jgi:ABC-type polysaccharide/polyol phosphate export permease
MLKDIWKHRTLIWAFVKRDLKGRYIGSTVGFLWSVIQPLVMILIYAILFSKIMQQKVGTSNLGNLEYVVYLCAGILPWITMQDTFIRSCGVFIENASLIKKVAFPPVILVANIVLAGFINLLIGFAVFFAVMLIAGVKFGWYILLFPVSLAVFFIFLFTFSLILATFHIFFRDTQQIVSLLLTVWFWATPIVYLPKIIPENLRFIIEINPANFLINIFRDPIYANQFYHWREASVFLLSTILILILGSAMFKKLRKHIPDEI